jgi:hypothetical protein
MTHGVHHPNFLVRDLDETVGRCERTLGLGIQQRDEADRRRVVDIDATAMHCVTVRFCRDDSRASRQ